MAPEVGLEPTTLRLTAAGVGVLPVTICRYKLLYISYLRQFLQGPFTTRTTCFATGFERVTTQNPPHFLAASLRRHRLVAHQHSANCSIRNLVVQPPHLSGNGTGSRLDSKTGMEHLEIFVACSAARVFATQPSEFNLIAKTAAPASPSSVSQQEVL